MRQAKKKSLSTTPAHPRSRKRAQKASRRNALIPIHIHSREVRLFLQMRMIGDRAILSQTSFGLAQGGVNRGERLEAHTTRHVFILVRHSRAQPLPHETPSVHTLPI